jgi:quinol monooxygenase YgiN
MIVVLGEVTCRPGHEADMAAASSAHVARARHVAGCLHHEFAYAADDSARLIFVEHWQDMASLQAHLASPETRAFAKAATVHGEGPKMRVLDTTVRMSVGF